MNTLENLFVPYEPSLRLKALGFDEPCFGYYVDGELRGIDLGMEELGGKKPYYQRFGFHTISNHDIDNPNKIVVTAPTYSQAFKFFREKYQIFPEVLTDCTAEPKFVFTYSKFFGNPKDLTEHEWGWENTIGQSSLVYSTYEEAELDCLRKLIEIVEQTKK